jgi:hypothetical protein
MSLATGSGYEEAHLLLKGEGRKTGKRFHLVPLLRNADKASEKFGGVRWKYHPFPAVKGETRMTPAKFSTLHPEGKFILKTAKHVHAVIDGIHLDHDRWDEGVQGWLQTRCVYGAYEAL